MNKKLLITLLLLITVETAFIADLLIDNHKPNEEVIRAEERIKGLEEDLVEQKVSTAKYKKKVGALKEDLQAARQKEPIIKIKYNEERNRIRSLSTDESIKYLAGWLSEAPVN